MDKSTLSKKKRSKSKSRNKSKDFYKTLFELYYEWCQWNEQPLGESDIYFYNRIFNWDRLDIDYHPINYVESGGIQLRKWNGERILCIGCGNYTKFMISDEQEHMDFYKEKELEFKSKFKDELIPYDFYEYGLILDDITYSKRHSHTGEYTINPIIAVNPSVVAYFDMTTTFECIPDHKFKFIYSEAGNWLRYNEAEIKRLLDNTTTSYFIGNTLNKGKNVQCVISSYQIGSGDNYDYIIGLNIYILL